MPSDANLWPVPAWVAQAWREAAPHRRTDAVTRAHFGVGIDELGPGGRAAVVGWMARLERQEGN